ncbi:putative ef hand domain protein [Phaeomoniella chlamydospora]|uniref:Putative ef hand domain protein n=1 Tax=Phaeomoniella chlamydospora TaxID=158046 RepID=A0A0G2EQY9_PHACM|nr:putative ef hand domain protein [Phaeomoniella chlamydospora]
MPTATQMEEEYAVSPEEARNLRRRAEDAFMDAFLEESFTGRTISRLEEQYLRIELLQRGLSYEVTSAGVARFNENRPISRAGPDADDNSRLERTSGDWLPADQLLGNEERDETIADDESEEGWRTSNNGNTSGRGQAQGLQNLVYNIAKEQAVRESYIHRGVSCNSCGMLPIKGIRYRCANCNDYDLCEDCEAAQVHTKTHLFFKVRIPAPFLGNGRPALPVWYPGKPNQMVRNVPKHLATRLREENDLESQDIDALWDQFSCLAATEWAEDPNNLGFAVDRKTFDRCFVPSTSSRPPPPNLLYDRMFAYYDTNHDGLIGFEEFISGVATLMNTTRDERLKRIFKGYDLDNDGFVCRKDFLRLFRAWFVVQKELTREAIAGIEDEFFTDGGIRDIIMSSQPISSAFPGPIPDGIPSRSGIGKTINDDGDLAIIDGQGTLRNDNEPSGDRYEIIADAERPRTNGLDAHLDGNGVGIFRRRSFAMSQASLTSDVANQIVEWPPGENELLPVDVVAALGQDVPIEEIMDPVDRAHVVHEMETRLNIEHENTIEQSRQLVIKNRWKRRQFYTDEEEGSSAPPGYEEADSSEEDEPNSEDQISSVSDSRPPSPRSRSSSKVRFEDGVTDTEYETRSNTSSRSVPVGERWGGFEIAEPEKDVGKDLLYLSVQQGFNELLDRLFKEKEDLAMGAKTTQKERQRLHEAILGYETRQISTKQPEMPMKESEDVNPSERPLEDLLDEAGYSVIRPSGTGGHTSVTEPESSIMAPDALIRQHQGSPNDERHDHKSSPSGSESCTNNTDSAVESWQSHSNAVSSSHTALSPQTQIESALVSDESDSADYRDPTLPQFRPTSVTSDRYDTEDQDMNSQSNGFSGRAATTAHITPTSDDNSHPSDEFLAKLSRFKAHAIEVEQRGGKEGTLNYEEFVRKMVGDRGVSPFDRPNVDTITGKDLQDLISTGEVGRLAFLGSWIEMASL